MQARRIGPRAHEALRGRRDDGGFKTAAKKQYPSGMCAILAETPAIPETDAGASASSPAEEAQLSLSDVLSRRLEMH